MQNRPMLDSNYHAPIPMWCKGSLPGYWSVTQPRDPVRLLLRAACHLDLRCADMLALPVEFQDATWWNERFANASAAGTLTFLALRIRPEEFR